MAVASILEPDVGINSSVGQCCLWRHRITFWSLSILALFVHVHLSEAMRTHCEGTDQHRHLVPVTGVLGTGDPPTGPVFPKIAVPPCRACCSQLVCLCLCGVSPSIPLSLVSTRALAFTSFQVSYGWLVQLTGGV